MVKKAKTEKKSTVRKVLNSALDTQGEQLRAYAQEKLADAQKGFRKFERKAAGYIRRNPEKAALIAAGVGAAIVAGMRMGHSKKK